MFFRKVTGFSESMARPFLVHPELHGRQFFKCRLPLNRRQPVAAGGVRQVVRTVRDAADEGDDHCAENGVLRRQLPPERDEGGGPEVPDPAA